MVTDITVIPEDQDIPDDYAGCLITVNSSEFFVKSLIFNLTKGKVNKFLYNNKNVSLFRRERFEEAYLVLRKKSEKFK